MENFDIVIIGAGPGGYVAAIRGAQCGFNVALIDKSFVGGACLNVGCIPSKALLNASHEYEKINKNHLGAMGINAQADINITKLMEHKNKIVKGLTTGIEFLLKKNKVSLVHGTAFIQADKSVIIQDGADKGRILSAKSVVIATGSSPISLPNIAIDEENIVSSTGALQFSDAPKKLIIIGAGVIGLELGSVWARLGSEVTIIEYLPRIAPNLDEQVARELQKSLQKQGIIFMLGQKILSAKNGKKSVTISYESASDANQKGELTCDKLLVCVGRKANTANLGLEALGVAINPKGVIITDEHYATNIAGIYAIGDCINGPMLAHKAEEEGVALMEMLAGQKPHVNYGTIPGVIYTHPEVADVGLTEEAVKAAGIPYKVGNFPFKANSRARSNSDDAGFVKIIAHSETDKILGVHIIGAEAGNLIHEAVLAMEYGGSSEDIARTCHAHPTLNEAIKEAALAVLGRAIHT